MLICHCHAVNDRAIAELARDETVSVDDIVAMCGAGGQCGGCLDSIEWIVSKVRNEATVHLEVASGA